MQVLVLVLIGMMAGYVLRHVEIFKKVSVSITVTTCVMLFMLGVSVGGNKELLSNLGDYGWQALLLCCAGLAGSILFTMLINRLFFNEAEKKGDVGNE